MMREDRLHAAVLAAPDDDAPRLAYAHWLIEQGDPRGEMIALQVASARLPAGDARMEELGVRQRQLWDRHGETWHAPYGTLQVEYARGFVESLRGAPAEFMEFGRGAVVDACVRAVYLQSRRQLEVDVPALIAPLLPHIRLRDLGLWYTELPLDPLCALLRDPGARDLESLLVHDARLGDGDVAMLASVRLARLRSLSLRSCRLTISALPALARWPATLQTLRLPKNQLGATAVASVIAAPALRQLSTLDLSDTGIAEPDAVALAEAALPLISLDLSDNPLGTAAITQLANSPWVARLERLALANTAMGSAGLEALLASPYLSHSLKLALDGGLLGLEPDIWNDWTGGVIGASWKGEPPEHVKQRFRVVVEGSPAW